MRPAFAVVIVLLALGFSGCLGGNGSPDLTGNVSNRTNATLNATPPAPQNNSNVTPEACLRQWTLCPSGEQIKTRDCIDGHKITYTCKPYWKAHNKTISDIPGPYLFLADYKCYWENREKFGYGAGYNPASVCEGPIMMGWKESCDCAGYVDIMERGKLVR
ncbi:Uncharacterised protein [Candidatus Burarchaeum australiense]|nr:Uncharacterised protein [Candidatus Burarchaeum australiense]